MENGNQNEKISLEEEILAPYNHLTQVRGKQLREKIARSFNYWLKVPDDQLQKAFDIMKMLHNAGLLLDDVQDNSSTRRGLPSAHCVYGVALTLNATIQILAKVAQEALRLVPSREGGLLLLDQFYEAVTGQGFEIYWRDSSVCPSEDEYLKMLTLKTGRMILFGVKLMQLFSQNKENYDDLVKRIGLYLQLRDDYCNMGLEQALEEMPGEEDILLTRLCSRVHAVSPPCFELMNKNPEWVRNYSGKFRYNFTYSISSRSQASKDGYICEDITEGKFTLPAIHAMRTPEGPQVLNIIRKRTRDLDLKKYCLALLEKSGGMQYTRDMLSKMDRDLRAELARLGGNPLLEEVLDDLLSWKVDK